MKRSPGFLLFLCLAWFGGLLAPNRSYAQTHKGDQEFSIGAGILSFTDQVAVDYAIGVPGRLDDVNISETTPSFTFFATYKRYIIRRLALGITCGWQRFTFNINSPTSYVNYTFTGSATTLAAELKFLYINKKTFHTYAQVSLGGRYYTETQTPEQSHTFFRPVMFNSQWTPFGISAGDIFSEFFEIGIGFKGVINGGFTYKITKKRKTKLMEVAQ